MSSFSQRPRFIVFLQGIRSLGAATFSFATLVCIASNSYAYQNCYVRAGTEYQTSSVAPEDKVFLMGIFDQLTGDQRKYANRALTHYIPNSPVGNDAINDLIYTLRYFLDVKPAVLEGELIFSILINFSGIHSHLHSLDLSRNSEIKLLFDVLESDPEAFRPLVDYHARAYNFLYWYGLCANGSPYALYYAVMKTYERSVQSMIAIGRSEIRVLPNYQEISRRSYFVNEKLASVRHFIKPCDKNAQEVIIEDYKFNVSNNSWELSALGPSLVGWYKGGVDEANPRENGRTFMSRERFEVISDQNATNFSNRIADFGILVALPSQVHEYECED